MIGPARHLGIASVLLLGLLLVGCADENGDRGRQAPSEPTADRATAAPGADGPRVNLRSDKTHAVQPGDELTLTIEVSGYTLDPNQIGAENEPGVGHYRVYLDDASGDEYLAVAAEPTLKVKLPASVTDGSHDLRVVLFENDGTPLAPPAEGSVLLIVYRL